MCVCLYLIEWKEIIPHNNRIWIANIAKIKNNAILKISLVVSPRQHENLKKPV